MERAICMLVNIVVSPVIEPLKSLSGTRSDKARFYSRSALTLIRVFSKNRDVTYGGTVLACIGFARLVSPVIAPIHDLIAEILHQGRFDDLENG